MKPLSTGLVLIIVGVILIAVSSVVPAKPVNLFNLGWAFVLAGLLIFGGRGG